MKQVRTRATPDAGVSERELAHRELARRVAAESIVLLENNGALPLEPCSIALYGAGARTTIKGGTGSGEVNERYAVTIEQGLENAGFTIKTKAWLEEYEQLLASGKKIAYKAMAKSTLSRDPDVRLNIMADAYQYPVGRRITDADIRSSVCTTCIYVIARQAGECSDRSLDGRGFCLDSAEVENLEIAAASYERVVLVINASGPMDLRPLDKIEGIDAILYFCQQGMEGGNALADIVTGVVTPSGCLASTWPMKYEDVACAMEYSYLKGLGEHGKLDDHKKSGGHKKLDDHKESDGHKKSAGYKKPGNYKEYDEEYKEGIYVGYRYFDSFGVAPRYEFGYGLSYTDFSLRCADVFVDAERVVVSAEVTNIGDSYSGKACVQLYASAPCGKLRREYQSLMAFAKTDVLAPGERQTLTLDFLATDLAGYDEEISGYLLERGDYVVRLGTSSRKAKPVAVLTLDETLVTETCIGVCRLDRDLVEIVPEEAGKGELEALGESEASESSFSDILPHLILSASSIPVKQHEYRVLPPRVDPKVEALLEELDIEDMLKVVVATGLNDSSPHFSVFGAAAYTTSHLAGRGIPNAALCDGPAGLRLNRTLVKMRNGHVKPTEAAMELMDYMPWILRALMLGKPEKGSPLYQHASAFPVGTALAQTWNLELIEQVGKAMGTEMVEFGASFLLAPGMNIQRNPLCGRNYEYYSEDPLLTGKMAAAMCRGVQSFEGCYATIKHYAANNQETDRNRSNSVVRERALREIYLKGFRIAVEEGGAKAVMTSYNKINGIYTPNSYDLCTKILRGEWGFEGVVMTDWLSTDEGLAGNGLAIKAGNDLICPGGRAFRKALKADLDAGLVGIDDIRLSCARVLEAASRGRTGMFEG